MPRLATLAQIAPAVPSPDSFRRRAGSGAPAARTYPLRAERSSRAKA